MHTYSEEKLAGTDAKSLTVGRRHLSAHQMHMPTPHLDLLVFPDL